MALSGSTIYQDVGFTIGGGYIATSCVLPANSLIVLQFSFLNDVSHSSDTISITNSGTALTWVQRKTSNSGAGPAAAQAEIWTALNTGAQTVNITVTGTSEVFTDDGVASAICISAWTGYDTTTPIGLTAQDSLNGSNTGPLSYSLGGTSAASSAVVANVACDGDHGAALVDVGSGYTALQKNQSGVSGWFRSTSEYKVGALTTVDFGALNDPYQYASVAIEIKAAAGGGDTLTPQSMVLM